MMKVWLPMRQDWTMSLYGLVWMRTIRFCELLCLKGVWPVTSKTAGWLPQMTVRVRQANEELWLLKISPLLWEVLYVITSVMRWQQCPSPWCWELMTRQSGRVLLRFAVMSQTIQGVEIGSNTKELESWWILPITNTVCPRLLIRSGRLRQSAWCC